MILGSFGLRAWLPVQFISATMTRAAQNHERVALPCFALLCFALICGIEFLKHDEADGLRFVYSTVGWLVGFALLCFASRILHTYIHTYIHT